MRSSVYFGAVCVWKDRAGVNMRRPGVIVAVAFFIFCFFTKSAVSEVAGDGEGKADLKYAQVEDVKATQSIDGSWCIEVKVRHNDEGWDHYANAWQVLDEEGKELAWRLLAHPHDDEQPFVRGKCDITIPPEVRKFVVRAKCNVHGFGGQAVSVDLSVTEGEKFRVMRPGK
jgi:hypothetical protein